ncbi:MAG: hypothetical protein LPJ98_00835, partial [Cyclobacteriaceae bacterium]|nr:hypothetical protein [Cyclobacteriaceae bacterium]
MELWDILIVFPAFFRKYKNRHGYIACLFELGNFNGYRVDFRIGIFPVILNFFRSFFSKPGSLGHSDIGTFFQKFLPFL